MNMKECIEKLELYYKCIGGRRLENNEKEALIKYGDEYIRLYMCVKKAMIEFDPYGIAFVAWDEYEMEIRNMTIELLNSNFKNPKEILRKTLSRNFDQDWDEYEDTEEDLRLINDFLKSIDECRSLKLNLKELYDKICIKLMQRDFMV